MLYMDSNEPILKFFIDQEISDQQIEKLKDQPTYIQKFK